jgi:hypothetical protein
MAAEAEDSAPTTPIATEASDADSLSIQEKPTNKEINKPEAPGLGLQNVLVQHLVPSHLRRGVLIPLKTTLEVRQDHTLVQAYITRAPTKSAGQVVEYVFLLLLPPKNEVLTNLLWAAVLCAVCNLTVMLRPCRTCADAPNPLTSQRT